MWVDYAKYDGEINTSRTINDLIEHGVLKVLVRVLERYSGIYHIVSCILLALESVLGLRVFYGDWFQRVKESAVNAGWVTTVFELYCSMLQNTSYYNRGILKCR